MAQIELEYASGRKLQLPMGYLPCYRFNSILPGKHSDDCAATPRNTLIMHFKVS